MAHVLHIQQSLHNLKSSSAHLLSSLIESSKNNYSSVVSEVSGTIIVSNSRAYYHFIHFKSLCQILQENLLLLFSS